MNDAKKGVKVLHLGKVIRKYRHQQDDPPPIEAAAHHHAAAMRNEWNQIEARFEKACKEDAHVKEIEESRAHRSLRILWLDVLVKDIIFATYKHGSKNLCSLV